jgi:hypothetical protein
MHQLITSSLSNRTRSTYDSAASSYLLFCSKNNIIDTIPATQENICAWLAELATSTSTRTALKHSSIKSYLSGLVSLHEEIGYSRLLDNMPLVSRICTGIKREQGASNKRIRLPINPGMLKQFKSHLSFSQHNHAMLYAAMCCGVFGLMRFGEFTLNNDKRDEIDRLLTMKQITLYSSNQSIISIHQHTPFHLVSCFTLQLNVSKTDPWRRGDTITIGNKEAVDAVVYYLRHFCSFVNMNAPLFQCQDGSVLTRSVMIHHTKQLCQLSGYNADHYNGHSFRRGGATSLAENGVAHTTIKKLGRWRSDAYQLYIDTSNDSLVSASSQMC